MAHKKPRKFIRLLSGSVGDVETADTINIAQSDILETAEFKALIALDEELFGGHDDDDDDEQ